MVRVVTGGTRREYNGADRNFKRINVRKNEENQSDEKKREERNYTKKQKIME
jgi:hypothetical protein